MSAIGILNSAAKVLRERGASRDKPNGERSMTQACDIFEHLTGLALRDREGWLFMVALKLARMEGVEDDIDNYIDLAGYVALLGECSTKANSVEAAREQKDYGDTWKLDDDDDDPPKEKMVHKCCVCGYNFDAGATDICPNCLTHVTYKPL